MLKIGLTGGIATGKSYVLDQLRLRGVACLDADELAHGVTAAGTEATAMIADRFGQGVLAADGSIDRKKLGAIVFADAPARRELEAMTHPPVYRAIEAGLRAFALIGEDPFAVVAVPLLYETGAEKTFDKVIVTTCTPETQLERLLGRGMTEEAARQRLAAQWPVERKAQRADFVITTDGTFAETDAQLEAVLKLL
ncbi:MAG TPA: dephospho-CoA kinase [Vicinamibacterales bacterium]|jgi:dephospho-CoA kinase